MNNKKTGDWIIRFVKGIFIGSGFVLPGVSGGALAAIFGIYERLIGFIAHIFKNFKRDFLYLLPVGLGGITGIFLLSFAVSYFLGAYETQILWFFIGCILGTFPTLWKQAGRKGRSTLHYAIMAASAFFGYLFLAFGQSKISADLALNFPTWVFAGAIIGLGVIVPGLSPSNFLVYLNLYKPMVDGIKMLDFTVLVPLAIGGGVVVLLFSKLMDYIFNQAYAGLFHFIFGIVVASTIMMIPLQATYQGLGLVICVFALVGGVALGRWMGLLEEKYKPEQEA